MDRAAPVGRGQCPEKEGILGEETGCLSEQPTLSAVDRQNEPIKVGWVGGASGPRATAATEVLPLALPPASEPEQFTQHPRVFSFVLFFIWMQEKWKKLSSN